MLSLLSAYFCVRQEKAQGHTVWALITLSHIHVYISSVNRGLTLDSLKDIDIQFIIVSFRVWIQCVWEVWQWQFKTALKTASVQLPESRKCHLCCEGPTADLLRSGCLVGDHLPKREKGMLSYVHVLRKYGKVNLLLFRNTCK